MDGASLIIKLLVKLYINENSYTEVSLDSDVLVCILLKTVVCACHKLARINEVWMLNVGFEKGQTRNHSTANNFISSNTV